jgi:hypothetical protein
MVSIRNEGRAAGSFIVLLPFLSLQFAATSKKKNTRR